MRKLLIILVLIASDALAQMYGTNYVAVMFDRQNEVFYPGKASEFVTNNAVIKALRMEDAALGADLFKAARDISDTRRAMMPRSASESGESDFSYTGGVVNIRAAHIDGLSDADGNPEYVECEGGTIQRDMTFFPEPMPSGSYFYAIADSRNIDSGSVVAQTETLARVKDIRLRISGQDSPPEGAELVAGPGTDFSPCYTSTAYLTMQYGRLHANPTLVGPGHPAIAGLAINGETNYVALPYADVTAPWAGQHVRATNIVPSSGSFREYNQQMMHDESHRTFVNNKTAKHYYTGTNLNNGRIFASLDTSCYTDMSAAAPYNHTCTLITPKHAVCAGHWQPDIGKVLKWFDTNGNYYLSAVVARTNLANRMSEILGKTIPYGESITICKLADPVFASPASILSTDAKPKLLTWSGSTLTFTNTFVPHGAPDDGSVRAPSDRQPFGLLTLTLTEHFVRTTRCSDPFKAEHYVNVSPDTQYPAENTSNPWGWGNYLATRVNVDNSYRSSAFVGGDSGSPTLLFTGPDKPPVILGILQNSSGGSTSMTLYGPLLQEAIDGMGNPEGYQITFEDLEQWPSYEE